MINTILDRFTRDLTADARAGRLEPIRCRAAETSRLIDILLRYEKNNAALVGPAGVGKTAIVEGLVERIAAGEVPVSLRGVRVLALDHVALLGGTMYRGQYEERVNAIVDGVTAAGDVILFVDELHNLIGQGTAMGAAMDAGNMLKPALVRGAFRVIGATTITEYTRWICGDPALERRFQKIDVRELNTEETLDILRARVDRLERHHNVVIADDAVLAAVQLTDQYIIDRPRPDRAIDALDEACAHAHAVAEYSPATLAMIERRRDALRAPAPTSTSQAPPREGLDLLDRLGAELEYVFGGTGADGETRSAEVPRSAGRAAGAPPRPAPELDAELRLRLTEDGIVVRGVDIARAIAVATNQRVVWPT
ncbi:MAG TPA: AAA family ATPase [Gemmatimonadaceae bacterium]|nr:AAA family ATPase [Gemmatimonadaceae bacterium]